MPVKNKFDRLNVVSPCASSWGRMSGSADKRHCAECNKFVFDFSQMTRSQIEAVVTAKRGQLCARITRREDGSLVMLEPPPPPINRGHSPLATAVVSAILGISVPATAQPAAPPAAHLVIQSGRDDKKAEAKKTVEGGAGSVRGVVRDPQEAVITGASVRLVAAETTPRVTTTSADGTYEFPAVAPGVYTLMVEAAGFRTTVMTDVKVSPSEPSQVDATLQIGAVTMGGAVVVQPSTLLRLHRESDLIAVVTVGRSKFVKAENESKQMLTGLEVVSFLKGGSRGRVLPFYNWVSDEDRDPIKPGDTLLVFLDRRKSDDGKPLDGYETSDWLRSVKRPDDAALAVYRQRIEELTPILERTPLDEAELIEWLVRCVEEPATRWDGANELNRSVSLLRPPAERTEREIKPNDQISNRAALLKVEEVKEEGEVSEADDDTEENLTIPLTASQKARVAGALFSIETLGEDDLELVELVQKLEDKKLAPYLASQLRKMIPEAPNLAEDLVSILAEILDDEEVSKAADHYRESVEYDDGDDERAPNADSSGSSRPQLKSVAAQIATAKRSALLSQFVSLVEQKINR